MTTDDLVVGKSKELEANLARVEELSQRMVHALTQHKPINPALHAPDHALFAQAATKYWSEMIQNPAG